MEWLNSNAGILVVIFSAVIIALAAFCICLLLSLRKKFILQKLNFIGFYSIDKDSRNQYATLTIGNKSVNDLSLSVLGIQNGKVNIELTDLYRSNNSIADETRIVIEQRSAISFKLKREDLRKLVIETNGKKVVKTLKLYVVDLTGAVYRGKIPAVRKLIKDMLKSEKND